jgi:hypothetical protein
MRAWMINKKEYPFTSYPVSVLKDSRGWLIGGDYPDYKNCHYIIESKGIEYTLKNGRMVRC